MRSHSLKSGCKSITIQQAGRQFHLSVVVGSLSVGAQESRALSVCRRAAEAFTYTSSQVLFSLHSNSSTKLYKPFAYFFFKQAKIMKNGK
jgi:hypothetical protein